MPNNLDTPEDESRLSKNTEEDVIDAEFKPINSSDSNVLEKEYLKNTDLWTKETLKARFGSCIAAYQHLKEQYGFKFTRSWEKVMDVFNGDLDEVDLEPQSNQVNLEPQLSPVNLEPQLSLVNLDPKFEILEITVKSQQQQIEALEDKLNLVLQVLINGQK